MKPMPAIEEINSPESSDTLNCIIDKISLQNIVVAKHDPNSHVTLSKIEKVVSENILAPEDANGFLYCAKNVFRLMEMQLDIYSDIYFNLLYCRNKDNYIPICLPKWSNKEPVEHRRKIYKSKKELFDSFSKNYKRNSKRQDYYKVPFNPEKKSEILNVAPNVSRLLVLSTKFCNVLREVDGKARKEYNFSYSDILTLSKDWSLSLQEDDMWLLAQLLNFKTQNALYNMFNIIFKSEKSSKVLDRYSEDICEIIKLVMKWPGCNTRPLIINEFIVYYQRMTLRKGNYDLQKTLSFLKENLEAFLSMHLDKYHTLIKNALLHEYIACSKNEDELLSDILEIVTTLRRYIYITNSQCGIGNKTTTTIEHIPLYHFIQGTVIECSNNEGN